MFFTRCEGLGQWILADRSHGDRLRDGGGGGGCGCWGRLAGFARGGLGRLPQQRRCAGCRGRHRHRRGAGNHHIITVRLRRRRKIIKNNFKKESINLRAGVGQRTHQAKTARNEKKIKDGQRKACLGRLPLRDACVEVKIVEAPLWVREALPPASDVRKRRWRRRRRLHGLGLGHKLRCHGGHLGEAKEIFYFLFFKKKEACKAQKTRTCW